MFLQYTEICNLKVRKKITRTFLTLIAKFLKLTSKSEMSLSSKSSAATNSL